MDYEKKCLEYFIKIRNHVDCRLYYEISYDEIKVYYYYDNEDLFDVIKDINILRQFLKNVNLIRITGILLTFKHRF